VILEREFAKPIVPTTPSDLELRITNKVKRENNLTTYWIREYMKITKELSKCQRRLGRFRRKAAILHAENRKLVTDNKNLSTKLDDGERLN
jgi:hypothetical protein